MEQIIPSHENGGISLQRLLELAIGDGMAVATGISDVDAGYALGDLLCG